MSDIVTISRVADLDDDDKPREKALKQGIGALTNAELIAITLGSGLPGKSVISLAQEILRSTGGSVYSLSRMSISHLSRAFKGVGTAKAVALAAAFELGLRCVDDMGGETPVIRSSADVYKLMRYKLQRKETEEFWILNLSRGNTVVSQELISRGGVAQTVVDVKLIAKSAVDHLSSGVIAVHNHPSGQLRPSGQDDTITQRIKQALQFFDVKLLDHIIISSQGFYSYSDEGKL